METDVRHIAKLAMLQLPEDQVDALEQEFASFIAMADRLPDLESADMLWEPEDERMTLREDAVVPSYPRGAMLQNASKTAAGCIVVPNALGISESSVKVI